MDNLIQHVLKHFNKRVEHTEKRIKVFSVDKNEIDVMIQKDRALHERGFTEGYWKGRESALYDVIDFIEMELEKQNKKEENV
jgi:hypothetical protein